MDVTGLLGGGKIFFPSIVIWCGYIILAIKLWVVAAKINVYAKNWFALMYFQNGGAPLLYAVHGNHVRCVEILLGKKGLL